MNAESNEGKVYTAEELLLLEDMVGKFSFETIANKLGRSAKAIESKLEKMGLSGVKYAGGVLSAHELAGYLNVDSKTLVRWKDRYGLPLHTKPLRKKSKYTMYTITTDAFWRWASKHTDVVDWVKYEEGSLVPEPDWLVKVRAEQRQSTKHGSTRRAWTTREDSLAWSLYYSGEQQKEIARLLGRSVIAVEKRLKRLRDKRLEEAKVESAT